VAQHGGRVGAHDVAAIELADAIVAEAGPLADGERARFVTDQAQRQIEALAVAGVTVVRDSHGRLLGMGNFRGTHAKII
jgi:hypothetical protein